MRLLGVLNGREINLLALHSMSWKCWNCMFSLKYPMLVHNYIPSDVLSPLPTMPLFPWQCGNCLFNTSNTFQVYLLCEALPYPKIQDILGPPPHRANQLITAELPSDLGYTFTIILAQTSSHACFYFWRVEIMFSVFIFVTPASNTVPDI